MGKDVGKQRTGIDFKAAQALLDQKKKEKADSGRSSGGDVNWMRLPETGELKVRFLPPIEGEPVPGMIIYKHYNLPDHEGIKGNITCFRTWNAECPICAIIEEYQDRIKLDDFFGASAYFNVLVLDHPECNPKIPYLLQASDYTYEWLLQQLVNIEVGDITDVEDGANVTFQRKKKKGAFNRIISRRSSAISDDPAEIDGILDAMYDMKKIWKEGDDNYYNIAQDLADDLREIIEDRLVRAEKDGGDKGKGVKEVRDAKSRRTPAPDYDKEQPEVKGQPEPTRHRRSAATPVEDKEEKTPEPTRERTRRPRPEPAPEPEPEAGDPEPEEQKTPPPAARERTRRPRPDAGDDSRGDAKKTPASTAGKPSKAPVCFGVEHNSDERKCQICPFEYDCENASA